MPGVEECLLTLLFARVASLRVIPDRLTKRQNGDKDQSVVPAARGRSGGYTCEDPHSQWAFEYEAVPTRWHSVASGGLKQPRIDPPNFVTKARLSPSVMKIMMQAVAR